MAMGRVGRWVRNAAVALIALSFVIYFGGRGGGRVAGPVAEVNGESISAEVFEFYLDQNERSARQNLPPDTDLSEIQQQLEAQTLEWLVQRLVLSQEAKALGLRVGDEEIRDQIRAVPFFQTDGRFDPKRVELFAARSELGTPAAYLETVRQDLLLLKLQRLLSSPVRVSETAVRGAILRERLKLRLRYVVTQAADFEQRVEIDEASLQTFLEQAGERIEATYQQRIREFQQPESIHARHILFTGDAALDEAKAARERLLAEEDFAALAKELSQDDATRLEGGDLGFLPRGRMFEAFEQAAFALEPGELSEAVETPRGAHLIRVDERRPALERSLSEVREQLGRELLRQDLAKQGAREAAEALLARVRAGEGFEAAAKALKLEAKETVGFGLQEPGIPGIGNVPGLKAAALELREEQPHATQVFSSGDEFYAISLLERDEPDSATIAAESDSVRDRLQNQARNQLFNAWYVRRANELKQRGKIVYKLPSLAR